MEDKTGLKSLLDIYGGPVPRYTSYPPATQFCAVNDSNVSDQFLSTLTADQPLSLYFHIPFCRSLCSYCGCMTKIVHGDDAIRNYVRLLVKEIKISSVGMRHRYKVNHIHFGGGSPNLLLKDDFLMIMDAVKYYFKIDQKSEIALEADPRQLDEKKVQDYILAGINRMSLGVQDFQESTQKAINRIQPFSLIESCVGWLRKSKIESINFDLMYGLPHQTVDSIADNVQKSIILQPDRIALFGYAHVPWMKPHQKILERYALPDSIERFNQAEKARETLLQNGYTAIGMDHFARGSDTMLAALNAGTLKRNFQGYTNDEAATLLGFGLSAISRFSTAYLQNTSNFGVYCESIENGRLPVERITLLTREDGLRADVIETLMCYFKVDCEKLCRKHGFAADYLDLDRQKLSMMEKDGLLISSGRSLTVTQAGKPFIRTICACFDAYYQKGKQQHARAV